MHPAEVPGLPIEQYLQSVTDEGVILNVKRLNEAFKGEAFRIFYGKGYTCTRVSAAVSRIVPAIACDSHEVLPVSSVLQGEYGINGVAVSVPSIVGKNGIEEIREMAMTDEEKEAFLTSAETIRNAAATVGML